MLISPEKRRSVTLECHDELIVWFCEWQTERVFTVTACNWLMIEHNFVQ